MISTFFWKIKKLVKNLIVFVCLFIGSDEVTLLNIDECCTLCQYTINVNNMALPTLCTLHE